MRETGSLYDHSSNPKATQASKYFLHHLKKKDVQPINELKADKKLPFCYSFKFHRLVV